ncbi:hypothetical protein MRX96_049654 [Rhipicephalus microplus]
MTPKGPRLAARLFDRQHLGMGRRALEYAAIVPEPPNSCWLPNPQRQYNDLVITTVISDIGAKRNTPQFILQQINEEQLASHILVFTEGAVTADGSAAAASVLLLPFNSPPSVHEVPRFADAFS